jgi:TRAP-type C4-dicarboxylate transport system permease small subunit
MSRVPEPVSATADLLYGWFYSAGIGGSVAALFFLINDSLHGRPFFTPTVLGSVAFLGAAADAVTSVSLHAVVLYSVVHFAAFGLLGLLATGLFAFVVLFVLMEGAILVASATVMPGVVPRLGRGVVFGANALTAAAVALFLRWSFTTGYDAEADIPEEREEELAETPALF